MLNKLWLSAVMSIGLLVVSGCSSTGTDAGSTGDGSSGSSSSDNGVETSGLGNNTGLSNLNAMVPGANQRYFFDYDKSDVHSSDLPSIKIQAQYLISHPSASVQIQGNTDIRGSREYNIALGQRRAAAVKNILSLDGVQANQTHTISYGAEKPVALGNTESDYAQNRRADVIYQSH